MMLVPLLESESDFKVELEYNDEHISISANPGLIYEGSMSLTKTQTRELGEQFIKLSEKMNNVAVSF